jgi:hypothetical protein
MQTADGRLETALHVSDLSQSRLYELLKKHDLPRPGEPSTFRYSRGDLQRLARQAIQGS